MRNRSFPVRILGWLTGVSLCLAAVAVWAQPPDLGLPWAGDRTTPGFRSGPDEGVLGEGDRVPKLDAGFTAPGPDRIGPVVHFGNLAVRGPYLLDHAAAGRTARTQIKVDPSSRRSRHRRFQTVEPPQIEHDEDAFPGLPLEAHSGTVKWVAPIQLAAGVKPESGQDRRQGLHAVVRCQRLRAAEGLSRFRPRCGPTCKR